MTDTMIAYHGDPQLKQSVLHQLAAHRAADEIVQKVYWECGKGCAVGCLTHDPDGGHDRFPALWGIPVQLAYLMDSIFEGLTVEQSKGWPERIMGAIPVGADLTGVWDRYAAWMLHDLLDRAPTGAEVRTVAVMAALFDRAVAGDEPSDTEWSEAARAAWAAEAARAARAARAAEAARAARAARAAWAAEAAWAAWAARAAWAAEAARAARAARAADQLVALCESAPIRVAS